MVRTMENRGRAAGAKSAKKAGGSSSSNAAVTGTSNSSKGTGSSGTWSSGGGGGNPVCPRETPGWQKPITTFFTRNDHTEPAAQSRTLEQPGSSKQMDDAVKHIDKKIRVTQNEHEIERTVNIVKKHVKKIVLTDSEEE